ncbi:oxidoreductase [Neokomagataea thailandica NBRC 106555]|uniref:Oxidoreductase n=2 Tax=Neokomagataea TaxID=1223423 RepID=A0A4Y6V8L0_9PROT|nr:MULTISPECIES: oxidoreductase [Neokomagataea]QDH24961.1 oxidoreductase [Neokomagataea tanensis]GBR51618.1 oxidoreductase [Neokomagataea thailandica NBRC 106555]
MLQEAPFRTALIGYGYAGQTFHAPLITAEPNLKLVCIASRQKEKVQSDYPGVTVVSDPLAAVTSEHVDLVVIASPNDTHAALAKAALQAGKHVVVDKPFALDVAEARDVVKAAASNGRSLTVFHNRRWDSDFLSIKQIIDAKEIGEVTHFESHIDRFRPVVRDRWREGSGPGAGIWFDLGPHLIDQALLLFGIPERVTASLAQMRKGALSDDWAHVVLEYNEQRVILHASMLVAGGSPRFIVHGTKGSAIKAKPDGQEAQLLNGLRPGAPNWGCDDDTIQVHDGQGGVYQRPATSGDQGQFYKQIALALNGGANPVPPLQSVGVMAVLEAAIHSARSGKSVKPEVSDLERSAWV